ncbi:MAG: hypothetical protein IT360_16480 [Gemmatimonadaceae bacterium]|nr:hypothetical protein [Gemmatimonadaceae bacterium]
MNRTWMSLAVAVVVLAIAAPAAQAQAGGPPPGGMRGGAGRMMEMLLTDITLDAAQQTKLDAIRARYAKEMPAMTPGVRPSPEEMGKRRELNAKQQDEIRTILNAEQQATFDKNLAAVRERMPRGRRT